MAKTKEEILEIKLKRRLVKKKMWRTKKERKGEKW